MSCPSEAPQPEAKPAIDIPPINVNGVVISVEQIGQEAQNHPANTIEQAIQMASEALVIRELMVQYPLFNLLCGIFQRNIYVLFLKSGSKKQEEATSVRKIPCDVGFSLMTLSRVE